MDSWSYEMEMLKISINICFEIDSIFAALLKSCKTSSCLLVAGLSCAALGLVIFSVTFGLAMRRYSKYRGSAVARLWEMQ